MQETPALTLTRTLTAATAACTFVGFSGEQTAAGAKPLGATVFDGSEGDAVAVDVLGTTMIRAGGAFEQGDALQVGAGGKAIAAAAGVTCAYAMQPAAAEGAIVEVLLVP